MLAKVTWLHGRQRGRSSQPTLAEAWAAQATETAPRGTYGLATTPGKIHQLPS